MGFGYWTGGQGGRSSYLHLWCTDQGLPEAQKAEASLEFPAHLCHTGSLSSQAKVSLKTAWTFCLTLNLTGLGEMEATFLSSPR